MTAFEILAIGMAELTARVRADMRLMSDDDLLNYKSQMSNFMSDPISRSCCRLLDRLADEELAARKQSRGAN